MNGQMCEAHLVQRSAQVEHALLALPTQLHVPPQEGEALKTHAYVFRKNRLADAKS